MEFKTRFNIGDHVWFMKDNLPTEAIISAINIFHVGTSQDRIKYNAEKVVNSTNWLDYTNLGENCLFKTKRDLFALLFGKKIICKGLNCSSVNAIGHSSDCIKEHDRAYLDGHNSEITQ